MATFSTTSHLLNQNIIFLLEIVDPVRIQNHTKIQWPSSISMTQLEKKSAEKMVLFPAMWWGHDAVVKLLCLLIKNLLLKTHIQALKNKKRDEPNSESLLKGTHLRRRPTGQTQRLPSSS